MTKLLKWKKCKSTNLFNNGRPSNILFLIFNTFAVAVSLALHIFLFSPLFFAVYSFVECFSFAMASCLSACRIKWAVTLAWAAKSERKNQIEMTQLMAFMVYAHFIIMRLRFFSLSLFLCLSAIFQHFPLLAISSRDEEKKK